MITKKQITRLYEKKYRVAVIGDIMVDRYIFGNVDRVSPEAPVPVCRVTKEESVPGGAANVARNLADFGGCVYLLGVIGCGDKAGNEIKALSESMNIDVSGCIETTERPTTVKTRIVGNGQQIARVDRESDEEISKTVEEKLYQKCRLLEGKVDLIIVSDYSKGVLTEKIVNVLRQLIDSGIMVAVDPHPSNKVNWDSFSIIKPNLHEFKCMSGNEMRDYESGDPRISDSFKKGVFKLIEKWKSDHLLVTLSADGMYYYNALNKMDAWQPTKSAEVFDVSGAGDTSMAFFALALTAGWNGEDAMSLANAASGIVIRKMGTASVSCKELIQSLTEGSA